MTGPVNPVIYEQPLNERIRTLLRLEHLFQQAAFRLAGENTLWDSRAALDVLLAIQSVLARNDVRSEVLKELERHATRLTTYERNPNVDSNALQDVLAELDAVIDRLHAIGGQIGQKLKDNEFLNSVRQRSSVAGGTCGFDLPAYHYWLQRAPAQRQDDLLAWHHEYDALRDAVYLILRIIRQSTPPKAQCAEAGYYQQSLDTSIPYQLLRVMLPADSPYFAEVSAGKHRFTIRFMQMPSMDQRPMQAKEDIDFHLSCCVL